MGKVKKFKSGISKGNAESKGGQLALLLAWGGGGCEQVLSILALLKLPGPQLFTGVLPCKSAQRGSSLSFVRG